MFLRDLTSVFRNGSLEFDIYNSFYIYTGLDQIEPSSALSQRDIVDVMNSYTVTKNRVANALQRANRPGLRWVSSMIQD